MRQVVLGKSGLKVSAVGFGGIPIQRVAMDQAVRAIHAAMDVGVNFIDTAIGYSDSEQKIGQAIRGRRDGLVLASKSPERTREGILRDIDRSRAALGADCIDLYQLHGVNDRPSAERVAAPDGAIAGLLEARERGLIAHLGVTSHSLDLALELIENPVFETIQFPFNLVTAEPAERLIPRSRELKLGFIVMKPLCGGQFENAELAFKFLNAFADLVPIPGVEKPQEIVQIARIVESGQLLAGRERTEAQRIADELGKLFCRRCGYCMPCPEGVPITTAMIFDSFIKRFPPDKLRSGPAREIVQHVPKCTECGLCESKCPYNLPIIETLKQTLQQARELAEPQ